MNYIEIIVGKLKDRIGENALPADQPDELLRGYAVLCLTLGQKCSLQDVHDAWSAWMTGIDPEHESIVPFDRLATDVQREDGPYLAAILEVSAELA